MADTVPGGFSTFLGWLTPSAAERSQASSHRASIESKLDARFGLYRMFESGSWKHGTGVSGKSDVDYFVSLKSAQPQLSSSILSSVRDALKERFPSTYIHVSRPAVVLEFGSGSERVEVIPAYAKGAVADGGTRFEIPGVVGDWLDSTPEAHLNYVNDCNGTKGVAGGAKQLARLAKAWKYYRDVPISSFYLEMRAAEHMARQSSIIYSLDVYYFLKSLQTRNLASMNDPTGNTGQIRACSSDANRITIRSHLDTAVSRAEKAVTAEREGYVGEAFRQWNLVFNSQFPSYY